MHSNFIRKAQLLYWSEYAHNFPTVDKVLINSSTLILCEGISIMGNIVFEAKMQVEYYEGRLLRDDEDWYYIKNKLNVDKKTVIEELLSKVVDLYLEEFRPQI